MNQSKELAALIKQAAADQGFDACGIAPAALLTNDHLHLMQWLEDGYAADMDYMHKHAAKRHDVQFLVEGAQSVVVMMLNHFPENFLNTGSGYRVAAYAYGQDYHFVIKEKLQPILKLIADAVPGSYSRGFTDSAPLLEKAWAREAGLGWIGNNSLLINKKIGSFTFLAEIVTTAVLDYDPPETRNYCGHCTHCIEACPAGAITGACRVDARKCISYQTIEHRGELPEEWISPHAGWIYGCDICQMVCPWNRFATPHQQSTLKPADLLQNISKQGWEEMTESDFKNHFAISPLKRTGFANIKRNLSLANRLTDRAGKRDQQDQE